MKKSRKKKLLIFGIVLIIAVGVFSFIYFNIHHFKTNDADRYIWVFTDSASKKIDKFFTVGLVGRNDCKYNYLCNKDTYIDVWDFHSLSEAGMDDIFIYYNREIDDADICCGEVLDKDLNPCPIVTVQFGFKFKKHMAITVGRDSEVLEKVRGKNYKGFIGYIDRITLSTLDDDQLVKFDFSDKKELTLFIVCKKNGHLMLIRINSSKPFDRSILNILDLQ
jgi:hypothetical protein